MFWSLWSKNKGGGWPSGLLIRIEKTDKLIRNMRWRAYHYLHPTNTSSDKETYGLNSRKAPPVVEEMKAFQNRTTELIRGIEFDERTNDFQKELAKDVKCVRYDDQLVIKVDKTTNFYRMKPNEYKELLDKNIHKGGTRKPKSARK